MKPPIERTPFSVPPESDSAAETLPQKLADEEAISTTLWLIRHAEVEESYHHVFGGRIDMELSPHGHEQAATLAQFLQGKRFDVCYASPMKRVHQTLESVLKNGMPKPVVLSELREVDFGDWTGLHWSEVQEKYGVSAFAWLDQLECDGIPNAESSKMLRARVEPCLRKLLRKHRGEQVAIVCHGGIIRVILSLLLDLPLSKLAVLEVDYASVTKVVWTPAVSRLELANFTPWRDLVQ